MRFLKNLWLNIQLMGFRARRDEFYEQLAKSYECKESLRDFLQAEGNIASAKSTRDASRALALRMVRSRLAAGVGSGYSQLLAPVMPAEDRLLLVALDDAKDKPHLLRYIAECVRSQRKLTSIVRGQLIPPLLILPGALAFAYILATKSLPIVVKIAPPEVWTPFNMAVRLVAGYFADYGVLTLAVVAVLLCAYFYQLPRWTGRLRTQFERVPPWRATLLFPVAPYILPLGIYRDVQVGRLFSVLSVMLSAGRTLKESLQDIRNNSQPWMRLHIRRVIAHLDVHTTDYVPAFSKGLLSPHLLARLSSQIRTNPHFDQVLIQVGKNGSEDILKEVQRQTSVINAFFLAMGGLLVVFMMAGQLSISFSLTEEMSPQRQMKKRLMQQQQQQPLQMSQGK